MVGHDPRERRDGHLDGSELLAVGPVALNELGHHRGRAPVLSRLDEQLPHPGRRTERDPQTRVRRPRRTEPLVFARERFHVHAPPPPLGERRSDRIQYGIAGADVHPDAPPVVRAEGAGKHHVLLVLRIRHERMTAQRSAPAPAKAAHRSPNEAGAVVTSCAAC